MVKINKHLFQYQFIFSLNSNSESPIINTMFGYMGIPDTENLIDQRGNCGKGFNR